MHQAKKLALVLTTSVLLTNDNEKVMLEKILCIYYLVCFQKNQEQVKTLLNSGSKVNIMSPAYVKRLGLKTQKINAGAQK